MNEVVTIELPEQLVRNVRAIASRTQRRLEDVLVEWIDQAAAELPIDSLPDDQILVLCEMQLPDVQQTELSNLLALNREGQLSLDEREALDKHMQLYRRGLVRKAQALKVAVERGLKEPLG